MTELRRPVPLLASPLLPATHGRHVFIGQSPDCGLKAGG